MNVPLLVQLPPTVKELEAWAMKVVLAEIVMLPVRLKVEEFVAAVTVTPVLVPLPNVKFPETVVVPAAKVSVMLLAAGFIPKLL